MSKYQSAHDVRATLAALMGVHRETQESIAAGIGLSQGMVSLKLSGRGRIMLEDLDRIAEYFLITPADLLSGVEVAVTKSLRAKAKGGPASAD